MDRLEERLEQARQTLTALEALVALRNPTDLQRDACLLRLMLATEAVWKAAQRFLQDRHELEVGSPREALRTSLEIGLLDGEQAERGLVLVRDRNLVVHAYNEALAREVLARVPGHAEVLAAWLRAMGGR